MVIRALPLTLALALFAPPSVGADDIASAPDDGAVRGDDAAAVSDTEDPSDDATDDAATGDAAVTDDAAPDDAPGLDDTARGEDPLGAVDEGAPLGNPAPPPPVEGAPPVEEGAPPPLVIDRCRALIETGDLDAAIACTRAAPVASLDDVRRRDERLAILEAMRAPKSAPPRLTLQSFLLSGRPEFVLGSAIHGAILGPLVLAHGAFLTNTAIGGVWPSIPFALMTPLWAFATSTMFASPLVGGTLGLVGGSLLVLTPRLLTDGDSDFLRSAALVSAFNLALSWMYGTLWPRPPWERFIGGAHAPTLYTGIALASFTLPLVGAGALVALVDVPEGGGAAGLTTGAMAAVLSLLMLGALDVVVDPWVVLALMGGSAHAAYASTVGLSFLYPFHRMTTWLVDIGAFAGFLASAALVLGIPAGNPVAGYGGMAVGLVSGAIGGLLVAELVPVVVDLLPSLDDAVAAPLMLPSLDGRSVGVGMALRSPFESSPRAWR